MTETRLRYALYFLILGVILFLAYRTLAIGPAPVRYAPPIVTAKPYANSPLYSAVIARDPAKVERLLKEGADIEDGGDSSLTPLEFAANSGRREMVHLLLKHNANPNRYRSLSVLNSAVQLMPGEVPDLLQHGAIVNDRRCAETAVNCLSTALAKHDLATAKLLLDHGAAVNPPHYPITIAPSWPKPDHTWFRAPYTPLGVAAWKAPEFEATLLGRGARLGQDRDTILFSAMAGGRSDLAPHLIKLGANVNGSCGGETALTQAVVNAPQTVPFLLDHGANVDVLNWAGRTPLAQAAIAGNVACVKQLLSHGARVNFHGERLHTPLWYARKHHRTEVMTLLKAAGGRDE